MPISTHNKVYFMPISDLDEINDKINIIFETLESHIHLIEHLQEGIEKLFERIEKIEVYSDEVKKIINKVYYQQGLLQGIDRRIKELEEG